MEKNEAVRQLKLYFFDRSLESMNKAFFYGLNSQSEEWITGIVKRGINFMDRLTNIYVGESC